MLNFIRTHKRLMLFFTVLLIFPSFVFMGVQGFYSLSSTADVAKVGSQSISPAQYEKYYKNWVNQQTAQNQQIDPQVYASPEIKQYVLTEIITSTLVALSVNDARLAVTDAELGRYLRQYPGINDIFDANGKRDDAKYLALVQRMGFRSTRDFEEYNRGEIAKKRFLQVLDSNVLSQTDVDMQIRRLGQKYTIREKTFLSNDYSEQATLSDDDIKAYYEQNQNKFMAPATVDIEYIVLDREQFMNASAVSDEDAREFYEKNKDVLPLLQQRKASHILIEIPQDATPEQQEQAFTKAKDLLAQVKQDSSKFAELAKENSADEASAVNGGDVGTFGAGDMVEAFEQAAFSMNAPGVYDEIVETNDGYHILMVTQARVLPYEELSSKTLDAILDQIRAQKADVELPKLAEALKEGVHVSPESLEVTAENLNLPLQQAKGITLQPLPDAKGVLASPEFLSAVFAPQAIESKLAIQPVTVGSSQYASARVINYNEEHVKPFDDVKSEATELAQAAKELALAQADAQKTFDEWEKDTQAAQELEVKQISLMDYYATRSEIAQTVFSQTSPATTLPATLNVKLGAQGYAVVQVEKIEDDSSNNKDLEAFVQNNVKQKNSTAQEEAFVRYLHKKYKVKIFSDRLTNIGN